MLRYLVYRYRWQLGALLAAAVLLVCHWLTQVMTGGRLTALVAVTAVFAVVVPTTVVLFILDAIASTRGAHVGPIPRGPEAERRRAATPALAPLEYELGVELPEPRKLRVVRDGEAA